MDQCSSLHKTAFNRLAFIPVIAFAVTGIAVTAVLLANETKEQDQFTCYDIPKDKERLQDHCYDEYNKQYNKNFPLYGFVLLNYSFVLFVVYLGYSQYVRKRVEELDPAYKQRRNKHYRFSPAAQEHPLCCKLFTAYMIQLLVRVVFLATFFVLQSKFLYSIAEFPTEFSCSYSPKNFGNVTTVWLNSTSTLAHYIDCKNDQAAEKTRSAIAWFSVNTIFLAFSSVEVIYLLWKANKYKWFWARHLIGKVEVDCEEVPLQETGETRAVQIEITEAYHAAVSSVAQNEPREEICTNQSGTPREVQDFVTSLKRQVLNDTEYTKGLVPGGIKENSMRTDDTFVSLTIQTGRKVETFCEDRDEVLGSYATPGEGSITLGSAELLAPNTDTQDPRSILAVGRAGIGKTSLATKILRDWAKGILSTANQAVNCFDFVFLLQFRFLNFESNITLKELLSRSQYSVDLTYRVFQHILKNPEKVLLVFDGLDAAKKLDGIETDHQYENSHMEDMPVGALFAKLASGKLLHGATILTTTRSNAIPGAVQRFYNKLNQAKLRLVEILGFTPDQVQEYVNNFAPENMKEKIWSYISTNPNLLSFCYIPVNCFITCTYFMNFLQNTEDPGTAQATVQSSPQLPTTLTEIYKGALKGFLLNHHSSYRDNKPKKEEFNPDSKFRPEVEKTLYKLGMLAKKGLEEGRLIFGQTAIMEDALTDQEVQDMLESGLLHHLPKGNSRTLMYEEQYCFIHLTFQEFLAARVVASQNPEELGAFASSAVANNSKMQMVLRFVAGLLRCQESSDRVDSLLEPMITNFMEVTHLKLIMPLLHCLFELQSEERAKELSSRFKQTSSISSIQPTGTINDADCASLVFFFKHTEDTSLELSYMNIGPTGCGELAKLVESGNLKGLDLDFTKVGDKGLESISKAIKNNNCKLKHLRLKKCGITAVGAKHLSESLKSEQCQLTYLNISGNQLTDEGAKYIGNALVNCMLKDLFIENAGITAVGAKHFAEALKSEHCQMRCLSLNSNQLKDEGAKYLGDALENCKLEQLFVGHAGITAVGAKHFSKALKSKQCQLSRLQLEGNQLKNVGAKYLGDALKTVNCKLKCLYVKDTGISAEGAKHLHKIGVIVHFQ